jgi:hypothetical protein
LGLPAAQEKCLGTQDSSVYPLWMIGQNTG